MSAVAASTSVRREGERATCVLFNKQPRQLREFLEAAQRLDGNGVFCCFGFIPGGEKFYLCGQFYHPQVLTALLGIDGFYGKRLPCNQLLVYTWSLSTASKQLGHQL